MIKEDVEGFGYFQGHSEIRKSICVTPNDRIGIPTSSEYLMPRRYATGGNADPRGVTATSTEVLPIISLRYLLFHLDNAGQCEIPFRTMKGLLAATYLMNCKGVGESTSSSIKSTFSS